MFIQKGSIVEDRSNCLGDTRDTDTQKNKKNTSL